LSVISYSSHQQQITPLKFLKSHNKDRYHIYHIIQYIQTQPTHTMERRLDDPSNKTGTLLTLPLSDFPNNKTKSTATSSQQPKNSRDDDDLILISLPSTNSGITMEDLIRGKSVYILGDTSEKDIPNSSILPPEQQHPEQPNKEGVGGSIEPIAARLIVEGKSSNKSGKTMELTRVETSNTYIVVPPMVSTEVENDSNKRQKLSADSSAKGKKELVTMPARSIGLVPGEESPSCFFLDPLHLQPGHFASKLRGSLSRWMYDPFDPPPPVVSNEGRKEEVKFGYTIQELAHICRTSQSEIEYAIHNRLYGAEDALVIPSSSDEESSFTNRYGMLSEEGRQTVATAIVTALLESDLDLVWMEQKTSQGMKLSSLMGEIREHWHRLEGGDNAADMETEAPSLADSQSQNNYSQSQFGPPSQLHTMSNTQTLPLATEVIWHCLRPILHYDDTVGSTKNLDTTPELIKLLPDEVAKLAAHHVFLRGTPKSSSSSAQLGVGSAVWWEEEELMDEWSMRLPSMSSKYEPRVELLQGIAISGVKSVDDGEGKSPKEIRRYQYLPEAGLSLIPSLRIKSMFKMKDRWSLEETVPYLEKFVGGEGKVVDLLEKYAKLRDGKYVAKVN